MLRFLNIKTSFLTSSGGICGLRDCQKERVRDFVTMEKSGCGADDGRNSIAGNEKMIDCHKCEHYYVTWDKHFPHGCKAMKFKSKQLPVQARLKPVPFARMKRSAVRVEAVCLHLNSRFP